ncbi:hypothetical protein Q31b_29820 [Novipirellula aureliae]|uniref:Sialate O-acetylesterase domain-containing protein n=1 Tax=Novipirellula aureliae TaxID=2527966 RepID=A0A5C6DVW5_9BACT|nr:sialate O-acetylesterase [Novipirellula aureliae]TWU41533.1 hypothetical protein Q31b_29820 [Novipirellula aureliae]
MKDCLTRPLRLRSLCLLVVAIMFPFGSSTPACAEVRLPGIFGDSMVLQQQKPIRIWGWADPGENIMVTIADNRIRSKALDDGTWNVVLPPMKASNTPLVLTVEGSNRIDLRDVLIGEVWLCSGQSNMEWVVDNTENAREVVAAANHPNIRHIKIAHSASPTPVDNVAAKWEVCSPQTAGRFTAVGFYMAIELANRLDVPIGLINSSWGGTRIEPWTTAQAFGKIESLHDIYHRVQQQNPESELYQTLMTEHVSSLESWVQQAKSALQNKRSVPLHPAFPENQRPLKSHQDPTMLYNGMIHPIVRYSIRGAIWYQGESNRIDGMLYADKMQALIEGWRRAWELGDFPFYYVQLAPYMYGTEDASILPQFWEAQNAALQIPNTGMVVINDIATLQNIHPKNKKDVGYRLALLALKNDYGQTDLVARSPEMESMSVEGRKLRIRFKHSGGELKTRDGKAPSHFEIIGKNSGGFHDAEATIDGESVVLSSPNVEQAVAFRFAWNKRAEPNLTGATGLPVSAFRGGDMPTFTDMIPRFSDYQLVYDLDLRQLAKEPKYDVDRSAEVTEFDRVGYLLELESSDGGEQSVFVSMNAFTNNAKQIGIPTVSSNANFQMPVESMDVFSSTDVVTNCVSIATGNIEFWPNNYAAANDGNVENASSSLYDFGDQPVPPIDGYGSMQVHNHGEQQTIFAINKWKAGADAEIGIGNSSGKTRDWTFVSNASAYSSKRLRVYVRPSN